MPELDMSEGTRPRPRPSTASSPASERSGDESSALTTDDYKVGFRKPPREHQFKKGQTGNPKGRRPKSNDAEEIIRRVLFSAVKVRLGTGLKSITLFEALLRKLAAEALAGDQKAFRVLISILARPPQLRDPVAAANADPDATAADAAILAMFRESLEGGAEQILSNAP